MTDEKAKILSATLKALANPVRVKLVDELRAGDRCVCELTALAGVDQSNVSRHLAVLKRAGIVSERRDGLMVIHHLETPCILKAFDCATEVFRRDVQKKNKLMGKSR